MKKAILGSLAVALVAVLLSPSSGGTEKRASPVPSPAATPAATPNVSIAAPVSAAVVESVFPASESFQYNLVFIDTTAGELLFENLAPTTWEGKPVLHFRATVRTVKLIGSLYPYVETIDLYTSRDRFEPLFVDIREQYRKKTQHVQIKLDPKTLRGEEIEDSSEPDREPTHRKKFWEVTPGAQSLFSIIHYLRTQALKPGDKISFPISHDEKNHVFAAEVIKTEMVSTHKEEKEGIRVRIDQGFAKTFSNVRSEPMMWFSNDAKKILLRFELPHKYGRVIGTLKKHTPAGATAAN